MYTYSIPEIIFSYSSSQGTWLSFFAFSISCVLFCCAAMLRYKSPVNWMNCLFFHSLLFPPRTYMQSQSIRCQYDELGNDAKWGKREVTPDAMGQYLAL